ncbi:hypothetical protein [Empedobacter brevis]|uniref:hypothetical protein n=1 Tax=Empedobacter brevis TaxID=247 RepID=UPI0028992171|nr:hypothetical protein [Empedobacter brevis]
MATYTFGLAEILVAASLATGLMPEASAMTKIGEVLEGTANMAQEEGDKAEFKEEGNPIPKVIISKAGSWTWNFNIMNADPEMLSEYIGGSYNATSKEWEFDGKTKTIEKALFIKPKQGLYWKLPKASISAVVAGDLNEDGLLTLNFTVSPLSPAEGKPSILSGKVTDLPTG